MPAQTLLTSVLVLIFAKMQAIRKPELESIAQPQRRFLIELFCAVFATRGRKTFTNMARFSPRHEQTFRRHFAKAFDWVAFNLTLVRLRAHPGQPYIGVFDTSFLPKSGKHTFGLDTFFSQKDNRSLTGLEVSLLGVVATTSRRVFALDATQTPPGLARHDTEADMTSPGVPRYSRVDFYLEQITDLVGHLPQVSYWVGDGFYAKTKIFDTLAAHGKHVVTRLRSDANLRFLAAPGECGPSGRRRRYVGKVRFDELERPGTRFEAVGGLDDYPHVRLYTALVNSPRFRRDFRLVVLLNTRTDAYVVLASTDLLQPADEIVRYYRLRYQLELLIRDAKQYTGLSECQARDAAKLDFHLNMSVSAVNVGRWLSQRAGLSLGSYVRQSYDELLVGRLLDELRLGAEFELSDPRIQRIVQMGRLAA